MAFRGFRGQRGISILEVLIGIAMVGVSTYFFMQTTELYSRQVSAANSVPVIARYGSQLISNAHQMILNTKSSRGKAEEGVCRFVDTDAVAPGVASITVSLPTYHGVSQLAFPKSFWQSNFAGWDLVELTENQGCPHSDNWRKCFRLANGKSTELEEGKKQLLDLVGSVQIIPTYVNPNKGLFKKIQISKEGQSFDVKDVGFLLSAEISFKRNVGDKERTKRVQTEFIWAPSAGICDKKLNTGQDVILSLSGTGASNPDGLTIYNRSTFSSEVESPVTVDFRKTQIQQGKLADNGQFITTDTSKNIAVSCNERRYRCPLTASNERTYAPIDVTMDLEYFPRNALVGFAAALNVNPKITISKGYGDEVSRKATGQYALDGQPDSTFRVSGSHQLVAKISDPTDRNFANAICREICNSDNHYNKGRDSSSSRFRPALAFSFNEVPNKNFELQSDEEIGCTACFMKNCAQIGLGTFGPMSEQPDQPLDSNVPECWLTEPASANEKPFEKSANFLVENLESDDRECISARLDSSSDRIVLTPQSCSTELPVMCYGFGSFVLARKINSSSSSSLDLRTREAAFDACYDMGFETTNAESIQTLLGSSGSAMLPPASNGRVSFQNLAQQGIFLAPQLGKDISAYRRWATQKGVIGERFWIALQYKGEKVRSLAPRVKESNDNLILYYRENGQIAIDRYELKLDSFSNSNPTDDLLFHHVKYKGVLKGASSGKQLRYLCRKKNGGIFATRDRGNSSSQSDGESKCEAEGGHFERPETPIEWMQSLVAVKPLLASMPYPDLSIKSANDLDPVRVSSEFAH